MSEKLLNFMQTVFTKIRYCIMQHLIWVFTVCQSTIFVMFNYKSFNGIKKSYTSTIIIHNISRLGQIFLLLDLGFFFSDLALEGGGGQKKSSESVQSSGHFPFFFFLFL